MAESQGQFVTLGEWFQHVVSNYRVELDPSDESGAKLICNNCRGLAYLPYTTKCNHLFCSNCIQQMISKGRKCLVDNQVLSLQEIEVSIPLKTEIGNLKLLCPYKAHGCSKSINVLTAWEHVSECAQTYAMIDCPWRCGKKIQLNQLNMHFKTDCHHSPERSSELTSNLVNLNLQPTKQTACQPKKSRNKAPVVNMFQAVNIPPGVLRSPIHESQSPRQEPNKNKTVVFKWPIFNYLQVKEQQMKDGLHYIDSDLLFHNDLRYQFKIRAFLNGSGYGKGTHISLFIGVNRGFNKSSNFVHPHKLTIKMINQSKACNEIQMDFKKSLQYDGNKSAFQENRDKTIFEFYGFKKFCEQSKAEDSNYFKNGTVIFEVIKELM